MSWCQGRAGPVGPARADPRRKDFPSAWNFNPPPLAERMSAGIMTPRARLCPGVCEGGAGELEGMERTCRLLAVRSPVVGSAHRSLMSLGVSRRMMRWPQGGRPLRGFGRPPGWHQFLRCGLWVDWREEGQGGAQLLVWTPRQGRAEKSIFTVKIAPFLLFVFLWKAGAGGDDSEGRVSRMKELLYGPEGISDALVRGVHDKLQGRHLEVCDDRPRLCFCRRAFRSEVRPM